LVELRQIEELQRLGNYGFVEYEKLDEKAVKITKLYPKGQIPESFGIQKKRFLKTFGRSVNKPELFEFIEEVRGIPPHGAELDDVSVTQVLIQRVGRVGCVLRGEGFDVGSLANYQSVCSWLKDSNFWSSMSQVDNEEGMTPTKAGRMGMASTDSPTVTPTFNKQENGQELCERLNKVKFSVVIPVFSEEENLEALHTRLTNVMENLGEPYEIIFVDDGSKDGSFQIMKNLHQRDSNVKVIRLTRNFGQPAAKAAGFDFSEGDIVITIDADLEHPPEEIPKLIEKLDEGYEVAYGVFPARKHSAFRRAGSEFAKWVLSKIVTVSRTNISGFVAIRSSAIERLNLCGEKTRFLSGLLSWTGASIGTVEVEHHRRQAGKSRYGVFRLLGLWFDMVVSFTDLPLRLASIGGLLLGTIGLLLALAYVIRYLLYGFGVPGFATVVILLLVFFGFQFLYLGILGEYLARVNREVRNRPRYIVREALGINQADDETRGQQADKIAEKEAPST
ncbi:MAG: glycosyltransferase, partial [Thermoplasmata archaeon]|nr:glycosyltransferase [Thermoplasmata archaeon]